MSAPPPAPVSAGGNNLRARCIDLDTRDQPIAILRGDSAVVRSEGFDAHARVRLRSDHGSVIATLYRTGAALLAEDEIGLSRAAWRELGVRDGDLLHISHPAPLVSLSAVRGKIHGDALTEGALHAIMQDLVAGRYDDIQIAMFLTAIAAGTLNRHELTGLIRAMVECGERLSWDTPRRMDKHCVGGLPGNRTTPIVVAIVAENGLMIPKTSSRAITSPAGTADTMEMLAPVNLDLGQMRRVVESCGGCVVWGGAVKLSPADDVLIRVARVMDLDAEAQLIASVLSKKVAAGATDLVLDLPVGPTAKVRSTADGERLGERLRETAAAFGISARVLLTDGRQPVGRGIGPALEAQDVLAVLKCATGQPHDLRERAIVLAGELLEMGGAAAPGDGLAKAGATLDSGRAWSRFKSICKAQGGLRTPPVASERHTIDATRAGRVVEFDNRRIARAAKLAGAPAAPAAGIELHVHLDDEVERGQPLYTLHAESRGELEYAHEFAGQNGDMVRIVGEHDGARA